MEADIAGSTGPGPGPVKGMTQHWLKISAKATHAQKAAMSWG
jgi:hypothetical protein